MIPVAIFSMLLKSTVDWLITCYMTHGIASLTIHCVLSS